MTIPENSTCPTAPGSDSTAVPKRVKSKKSKGVASGLKMDTCGGYYGELSLPLVSPLGRVTLRNLGSGSHNLRFRLLAPTGNPVLLSPHVTSSKSSESLGR